MFPTLGLHVQNQQAILDRHVDSQQVEEIDSYHAIKNGRRPQHRRLLSLQALLSSRSGLVQAYDAGQFLPRLVRTI